MLQRVPLRVVCLLLAFFYAANAIVRDQKQTAFDQNLFKLINSDDGIDVTLKSSKQDGVVSLRGKLGVGLPAQSQLCSYEGNDICLQWQQATLRIKKKGECHHVSWKGDNTMKFEDCFSLGQEHWFGGPEEFTQLWPFEKLKFTETPYVTTSVHNQGIVEPYWVNSKGAYIYVDKHVPLFINQNETDFCLIAKDKSPYPKQLKQVQLEYKICAVTNARLAHEYAINNDLGKPNGVPDERMIRHPIWSTWARYKSQINETTVLEFADQVLQNNFNNSQLEIDDMWEPCYGALVFDEKKFVDIKQLTDSLKKKGFRTTLWIHPFINTNCEPYHSEALEKGYFVRNTRNDTLTTWWNGEAGAIDFTNTEAVKWWVQRLRNMLDQSGIDSLKFDAGETSWLPQPPILNASMEDIPNIYTTRYLETVSQFGPAIEARVAVRTQYLPMFIRMLDKDSVWGWDNGLKTLVTTLLQMNMAGYPLVLPDMIGGNAYGTTITKELFIRWLQANTFMPSLQFSFVPWDFDNETVEIAKKFTALHEQYTGRIIQLAKQASQTGTPINPPVWWIDPEDSEALGINDEFLLGEDILVAPVLEQGATSRDIYLPKGLWRDELDQAQDLILGRTWLRNYSAPLSELPYFTRVSSSNL